MHRFCCFSIKAPQSSWKLWLVRLTIMEYLRVGILISSMPSICLSKIFTVPEHRYLRIIAKHVLQIWRCIPCVSAYPLFWSNFVDFHQLSWSWVSRFVTSMETWHERDICIASMAGDWTSRSWRSPCCHLACQLARDFGWNFGEQERERLD